MCQREAFYRQRIPESSCARKEIVDIDILVTSRNGARKIMQSIRITCGPPSTIRKLNQLSQFRLIFSSVKKKLIFFLKNRSIQFFINSTSVIRMVKRNHLSFSSIEINKPLPDPVVDQIQAQDPILVAARVQMPDHT